MADTLLQFARDPAPWAFWGLLGACLAATAATAGYRMGYRHGFEDGVELADPEV